VAADANVGAELTIVANSNMVSNNGFPVRRKKGRGRLHVHIRPILNPGVADAKHQEVTNVISQALPKRPQAHLAFPNESESCLS
jgi:hypothetical protein